MSAAVAHAAGAGVSNDVSNLIDLDLLQRELDSARGQVDMWVAQRELNMKEAVLEHKDKMVAAEELKVDLREKEEKFLAAASELRGRKQAERAELEALMEEANLLKDLGSDLPEELQISREHVNSERIELERETAALAGDEMVKAQMLLAHQGAVDLYGKRLGLRFETGEDQEFKFFFKFVDPADHEREFMVAVRVMDAGGYELVDCEPEIEVDALLEECNRTDNLSGFVRGARRAFRSLVAAGEVAAAAAALSPSAPAASFAASEDDKASGAAAAAAPNTPAANTIGSIGDKLEMLPLY